MLELGEVKLKSGEQMKVKLVVSPAGKYEELLIHFLDHKPDWVIRKLKAQLGGSHRPDLVDKFFVGEIDGEIAGQIWYGYPAAGSGIANFGEVYTAPMHRKKGVTDVLMQFFKDDFNSSPVHAALCTTSYDWVTQIYAKFGFQTVVQNAGKGPLILIRSGGRDFAEFSANYYAPGQPVTIERGGVKHRHDIDTLLRFTNILRHGTNPGNLKMVEFSGATLSGRAGPGWHVENFMDACFLMEDGKGFLTVAALPDKKIVGWAFILNSGSPMEMEKPTFDFELHPNYSSSANLLIRETLRIARKLRISSTCSWCSAAAKDKVDVLKKEGFKELSRIPSYCAENGRKSDMLILQEGGISE